MHCRSLGRVVTARSRRLGGDADLNLPYEENPQLAPVSLDDALLSGGLVVMGAVVEVPDVGPMPALVFRFTTPTGEFYQPVSLIVEDLEAFAAAQLVKDAANSAVRAAKDARRSRGLG